MRKNNNAWVKATYPKVNLSPYPALQSGFVSSFFPPFFPFFFPSVFFLTTPARLRQLIPLSSPPVRISLKKEKKTWRAAQPRLIISTFPPPPCETKFHQGKLGKNWKRRRKTQPHLIISTFPPQRRHTFWNKISSAKNEEKLGKRRRKKNLERSIIQPCLISSMIPPQSLWQRWQLFKHNFCTKECQKGEYCSLSIQALQTIENVWLNVVEKVSYFWKQILKSKDFTKAELS